MNYNVIATDFFKKEFKKLLKKYRSIHHDLDDLISQLEQNPLLGAIEIGKNCYKIRLAISAKNKGKSGGARVIYKIYIQNKNIYLISIFDKSDKENISEKELLDIIKSLPE
jgi:mRNA-degrading endonuclease RelE of RelBE toxin-antitoxin system